MKTLKDTCTCGLANRVQELEEQLSTQKEKISELERRLGLNSTNSSKPPSSDGLRKPAPKSLRETTGKSLGGQAGHKGGTLKRVNNPDEVVECNVERCEYCKTSLVGVPLSRTIEKQETELKVIKQVTAYRADVKVCPCCKKKNTGKAPKRLVSPAQYGPGVQSMGVYLSNNFVAKDRTAQVFKSAFDLDISDTTLISFDKKFAHKLSPFQHLLDRHIRMEKVKGLDETGVSVNGIIHWIHIISTPFLTSYRISKKRGDISQDVAGILVHDHLKSYFQIDADHAICNAHILRELKGIFAPDKEPWAKPMYALLAGASKIKNASQEQISNIEQEYDALVQSGLEYHEKLGPPDPTRRAKRPGHNLLIRLQKFKIETLRFLHDPLVPFTNNMAERDLRMTKVKQKVSGGFRTFHGAQDFVLIRSFISTLQKQGLDVFDSIRQVIDGNFDFNSLFTFQVGQSDAQIMSAISAVQIQPAL